MTSDSLIPSDPESINYLEYNIEFSPETENYASIRLGITLAESSSSSDLIEVATNYENVETLVMKKNYIYTFSKENRIIVFSNLEEYDNYIKDTHIDFLIYDVNAEPSPRIRIDEIVDFSKYFLKGISEGLAKVDTPLMFLGVQTIENKYLGNLEVNRFQMFDNWGTQGSTPDAVANWTLKGEAVFDKSSGVLVSKSLMLTRVDLKPR